MKRKIALILIILLSLLFLNMTFAAQSNYITPTAIHKDKVIFSNDLTGFCLDSSKDPITLEDNFTKSSLKNDKVENYVKLAIIESYKQGKESSVGDIISKIAEGKLDRANSVIEAVLNSGEVIKDKAVVNIDNKSEATFNFELLKASDENKSSYLTYSVTFKNIEKKDNSTLKLKTSNKLQKAQNNSDVKKENNTLNNQSNNTNNTNNKTNTTNKTVVNKTTTTTVKETNTTVVKNVKTPKNTSKDNDTGILKKTGIPIVLLVVVIVIIIAVVIVKRRD